MSHLGTSVNIHGVKPVLTDAPAKIKTPNRILERYTNYWKSSEGLFTGRLSAYFFICRDIPRSFKLCHLVNACADIYFYFSRFQNGAYTRAFLFFVMFSLRLVSCVFFVRNDDLCRKFLYRHTLSRPFDTVVAKS